MNKKILVSLILISSFSLVTIFAQGTKEVVNLNQNAVIESNIVEEDELFGASAAAEKDEFSLEEMLQYALQDERLALAEYELIVSEFNVTRPFTNIIKAEETLPGEEIKPEEEFHQDSEDLDSSESDNKEDIIKTEETPSGEEIKPEEEFHQGSEDLDSSESDNKENIIKAEETLPGEEIKPEEKLMLLNI